MMMSSHRFRDSFMLADQWQIPNSFPTLQAADVHIWCADLSLSPSILDNLAQTLSADEQTRAQRFKFELHRNRFIAGRGILRLLLARYLHISPEQVCFIYNAHSKPELDKKFANTNLNFNVSHSHELALYGFTLQRQIGVDIEWLRADVASDELAQRFFAQAEYDMLQAVTLQQRTQAFFYCWTRKEAFIKAVGMGLSYPLKDFIVNIDAQDARLLSINNDPTAVTDWHLHSLRPGNNYVGAAAVKGEINSPRLLRWANTMT